MCRCLCSAVSVDILTAATLCRLCLRRVGTAFYRLLGSCDQEPHLYMHAKGAAFPTVARSSTLWHDECFLRFSRAKCQKRWLNDYEAKLGSNGKTRPQPGFTCKNSSSSAPTPRQRPKRCLSKRAARDRHDKEGTKEPSRVGRRDGIAHCDSRGAHYHPVLHAWHDPLAHLQSTPLSVPSRSP